MTDGKPAWPGGPAALIVLAFPLLAPACGGLLDWEASLAHAKCGQYFRLGDVGPGGWAALVAGWCVPTLPLLFQPDRARRRFHAVEAVVMAVPLAGMTAMPATPGAVDATGGAPCPWAC